MGYVINLIGDDFEYLFGTFPIFGVAYLALCDHPLEQA
jgi:hypothetical protein